MSADGSEHPLNMRDVRHRVHVRLHPTEALTFFDPFLPTWNCSHPSHPKEIGISRGSKCPRCEPVEVK